jgi:uncharacterized protein YndB with AHSA1/START domain
MRVVESTVIGRPPEEVWAVVADLDSHTEWRPALREFRQVSAGPVGAGTRIREVLDWRGREIVIDDVIVDFDPPRRFALRGGWKAADFELAVTLEPVDGGTRVTMDWPLHPKSLLLRVAAPFIGPALRRATREELALLKQRVEA